MKTLLTLLLACTLICTASAQNITGTIVGTVKDSSGAVLPNATITLTNVETNAQITVRPNEDGEFTAPNLAPGLYTIKTEASSFKQYEGSFLTANRIGG